MNTKIKSINLHTDVTLQYVEQGDPSGVPVLFLHGMSDTWRSYESFLPHLPKNIHAFALTLRGHGDSSHPETGYTSHDFAEDIAAFIESLQLDAAVLVGHSMGTTIAQRIALDNPGRLLGLVLISALPPGINNNPAFQELSTFVSQLEDPVDPDFVREFQKSTLAQPVSQAFLETVVQESLKLPARVWKKLVNEEFGEVPSEKLREIITPTLFVWGNLDQLVSSSDQKTLSELIPNSHFLVYENTGHAVHWEMPAQLAKDLMVFIESVTP